VTRPAWHVLLGPLPPDAVPRRQPVGTPAILATSAGAAIAGWEQLVLDLSAGAAGLRVIHVLVDGEGRLLSASDTVLYRSADAEMRQESVGGRFEADGSFRGACWLMVGPEPEDDAPPAWESTSSEPTAADVTALGALVAEMVRRSR
jgi:hypothetical protein